jgi:hypothetical protein
VFPTVVGLLIVHGIGEQRRGQTSEKLLVGLKAAYGDALQIERDADNHPRAVTANGRTVRLYEVYWADVLSAEKSRGSFTWRIPSTLVWHPSWCRQLGMLPAPEYSGVLVRWRVCTLVPLVPAAYLLYIGARLLAQILDKPRREAFEQKLRARKLSMVERSKAMAAFTADTPTLIDEVLDSVVADIPNYMGSIVAGEGAAFEILDRFHAQMAHARTDGCDEVHVLAHSLGTVIAFHALSGLGLPPAASVPDPRGLYTIGSPLEKIRFFWPWTLRAAPPSTDPDFEWINFHHRADRVSGDLRRFAAFCPLRTIRLKGGGGLLRSHVVYERSPEFLSVLTGTLFGTSVAPRIAPLTRLKDITLSWGENLLAPLLAVSAVVLGLMFVLAVVLIPAYLIAWPFRWLGAEALGVRVENGMALFTLFGWSTAMLLQMRARRNEAKQICESARRRSA